MFVRKIILVLALLFLGHDLYSSSSISIDHNKKDCFHGWLGMGVVVTVEGEKFEFYPSCNFKFSKEIETSKGLNCLLESGMCTGFTPFERFEVYCEDGSTEGVDLLCPML